MLTIDQTVEEDRDPTVRISENGIREGSVLVFTSRKTTYELGIICVKPFDITAVSLRSTSNGMLSEGQRVRLLLVDCCGSEPMCGQQAHFFTPEGKFKFNSSKITSFETRDPSEAESATPFDEYPRPVEAIEAPRTEPQQGSAFSIALILAAVAMLGLLTYLIRGTSFVP